MQENKYEIVKGWHVRSLELERAFRLGLINIMRRIRDLSREDPEAYNNSRIKNLKQDIRQLQRDLGHLRTSDADITWPPEYFERYNQVIDTARRLGVMPD
tara:strand:+ start:364 stop:663 length:300 start_codon:yes stop_codon:yes gene_type:complete